MLDLNKLIATAGDVWTNQYHTIMFAALGMLVWALGVIALTGSVLTMISSWNKLKLKNRIHMIMLSIIGALGFGSTMLCDFTDIPIPGLTRAPDVSTCIERAYNLNVENYAALDVANTPITNVLTTQTAADVTTEDGTIYRISLDDGVIIVTDLTTGTIVQPVLSAEELATTLSN